MRVTRLSPVVARPSSWEAVRARLEEQDRFSRCGMAMDPEKVLAQLHALAGNGFIVRIPERVFRTVELRSQVADSVKVADREVDVTMTRSALHTTPKLLWYTASVTVRPTVPVQQADASGPSPGPLLPLHREHPARSCAARAHP